MANDLEVLIAGRTHTGLVRSQNEDSIAINAARGIAILADGMGGYNAGEVASGMATEIISGQLEKVLDDLRQLSTELRPQKSKRLPQLIFEAIKDANKAILDAARKESQYQGMGTTVVVAVFQPDCVAIAHVGDSRAYRLRRQELLQITRDHSLLQEQIDAGIIDPALARYSQVKNLVTRAVGVSLEMDVEIHEHELQSGDLYMLCSDGLSDMLSDEELFEILTREQGNLEVMCEALVQKANENGGLDNISVILATVKSTGRQRKGLLHRIWNWGA
ncbi:Stp1/IreP family PP2C-type Ser/Thr phosphatase [Herbaspirillum sp. HC18]|nr:Stp1/IreP family PP2C-type Ser/Thr phosphatase [Herbaspirillum sp. HC18]